MNSRLARLLVRLYPRAWRERYGAEFEQLLQDGDSSLRTSANVIGSALYEHIVPTKGGNMDPDPNSVRAILKHPSAFLPLTMSLTALAMLGIAAIYSFLYQGHGLVREPDEGAIAHLWQILMTAQMPIVLFFAITWLRRAPRQTLGVLALQAGAWLASCAPVYFLNL
jgi:hypothetical protein